MSGSASPTSVALRRPPTSDEVSDILACRSTSDQVGDFLQRRAVEAVLETISAAIEGDVGPLRCTIERSKLKPGSRLTVSATVRAPGLQPRPVTAIWGILPPQLASGLPSPVDGSRPSAPFTTLTLSPQASGETRLHVFVAPADPAFPSLGELYDPEHLAPLLGSQGIEVTASDIAVVPLRYRPGQRHVLRLDLAERGRCLYVKCYRDETGAQALAAWHCVQAALTDWRGPVDAVQPVGYLPAQRVMLWEGSRGTALGESLDSSRAPIGTAGAALRAIHDSGVDPRQRSLRSDPASEAASTRRACEHVAALLPGLGTAAVALAEGAVRSLDERPAETGHRLHGDYKCDNILVEGDRLRLLDLDRVTVGDPALDLGKMSADLRWWAAQRGLDATPLVDAFLEGYGRCAPLRLHRAAGYDRLFMLRLIGRRVPLHEPGWADRVHTMLAAVSPEGVSR